MKCNRTQEECRDHQLCSELQCVEHPMFQGQENYFQGKSLLTAKEEAQRQVTQAPERDRLRTAADAIRAKLKEEKATYQHYLDHCQKMKDIEDLHGGWDSFANASEVSNRIDTLLWCLQQMGMEV